MAFTDRGSITKPRTRGGRYLCHKYSVPPSPSQESGWCSLPAWQVSTAQNRSFENENYFISDVLSVSAVSMEDSGKYTCIANNSAGVRNASTMLQVVGERLDSAPILFLVLLLQTWFLLVLENCGAARKRPGVPSASWGVLDCGWNTWNLCSVSVCL